MTYDLPPARQAFQSQNQAAANPARKIRASKVSMEKRL